MILVVLVIKKGGQNGPCVLTMAIDGISFRFRISGTLRERLKGSCISVRWVGVCSMLLPGYALTSNDCLVLLNTAGWYDWWYRSVQKYVRNQVCLWCSFDGGRGEKTRIQSGNSWKSRSSTAKPIWMFFSVFLVWQQSRVETSNTNRKKRWS